MELCWRRLATSLTKIFSALVSRVFPPAHIFRFNYILQHSLDRLLMSDVFYSLWTTGTEEWKAKYNMRRGYWLRWIQTSKREEYWTSCVSCWTKRDMTEFSIGRTILVQEKVLLWRVCNLTTFQSMEDLVSRRSSLDPALSIEWEGKYGEDLPALAGCHASTLVHLLNLMSNLTHDLCTVRAVPLTPICSSLVVFVLYVWTRSYLEWEII